MPIGKTLNYSQRTFIIAEELDKVLRAIEPDALWSSKDVTNALIARLKEKGYHFDIADVIPILMKLALRTPEAGKAVTVQMRYGKPSRPWVWTHRSSPPPSSERLWPSAWDSVMSRFVALINEPELADVGPELQAKAFQGFTRTILEELTEPEKDSWEY